jgi:hypothetical protein
VNFRNLNLLVVLGIVTSVTACDWFEESKYSNCAIASEETSFVGEKLKNDGNAVVSRRLTEDCLSRDREIDGGDGKETGKVRWVVCLKGPDCDEAGMF